MFGERVIQGAIDTDVIVMSLISSARYRTYIQFRCAACLRKREVRMGDLHNYRFFLNQQTIRLEGLRPSPFDAGTGELDILGLVG